MVVLAIFVWLLFADLGCCVCCLEVCLIVVDFDFGFWLVLILGLLLLFFTWT